MKNLLITAAVALVACGTAFGIFFAMSDVPAMHQAARDGDAMAVARSEPSPVAFFTAKGGKPEALASATVRGV